MARGLAQAGAKVLVVGRDEGKSKRGGAALQAEGLAPLPHRGRDRRGAGARLFAQVARNTGAAHPGEQRRHHVRKPRRRCRWTSGGT
jgi:NAD(P)-dependent dehydrogenase (short-subunit alcohol dehydrogenase family)